MGREHRRRVPAERASVIRDRLRRARIERRITLAEAARQIKAERRRQAEAAGRTNYRDLTPTDVRRYEGGDSTRLPAPPLDYVAAAAEVYRVDPDWLLAEPVRVERKRRTSLYAEAYEQHVANRRERYGPIAEERRELREAVRIVLALSTGLPRVPAADAGINYVSPLANLVWEALDRRGLSRREILEQAAHVGRALLTPERLPRAGFRAVWELSEAEYRDFWSLQLMALRHLLRAPVELSAEEAALLRSEQQVEPWESRREAWRRAGRDGDREIPPLAEEIERRIAELLGERTDDQEGMT